MLCLCQLSLSRALFGILSFTILPVQAAYFTEPPSFELDRSGGRVTVPDLNSTYVLGQKVHITWEVPTVPWISLSLVHWGQDAGIAVASFISKDDVARNNGYYTWYIGEKDGITEETIATNPNFALRLIDPTGNYTQTDAPAGFIGNALQSRGFVVKANATSEPATESAVPSAGSSSLSTGAVAGIAVGCVAVGALLAAALCFWFLRRRNRPAYAANTGIQARHPTPTLHPVVHQQMRHDSAYASPNSSGDHMFVVPPARQLSHQTSNVSPISRRQTPPPSYPSPVDEYQNPRTELSGVQEPHEVPATNSRGRSELSGSQIA
ncbi:hypothetical protein CPAR01_01946 [Colletotrichum paranaense]|uniref:Uncharacterized protein n=1 Tax=Colletotrichum paranaense TaxID=1914294 RepID=A0ABQ9SY55_9PEZI|nr:uncharacterized protein CPAR01_01946 [Colletotrichum paranaense]KAK1544444.1 hypothetical protein CPAR01_01946 [Colletotrichum paranaense]